MASAKLRYSVMPLAMVYYLGACTPTLAAAPPLVRAAGRGIAGRRIVSESPDVFSDLGSSGLLGTIGNVSVVWSTSLYDQWYTAASLTAAPAGSPSLPFMVSGGNWYKIPYPFFLAGGDTSSSIAAWNNTDVAPGTIWPAGGAASAAFTGLDFTRFTTTAAAFAADGAGFPYYSSTFPALTDNIWETGPAGAVSADGKVFIAAATNVSNISNPTLNPKNVMVEVVSTAFPPKVLIADAWPDATGLMFVKLSSSGEIAAVVGAQQPNGTIDSSYVRVYNTTAGTILGSFATQYAWAGCLSPSGEYLLLVTTDSEDRLEAYQIGADGTVTQTLNASYPSFPSAPTNTLTFTFASSCRISDSGVAAITFSLWWNGAENQTAVATYQLPSATTPSWLWMSTPVASLQDDPQTDAMTPDGAVYAFSSWGGAPANASAPQPSTMHIFNVSSGAVIAEIPTVGSLEDFDMAYDPSSAGGNSAVLVLATGLDAHANLGNNGGVSYLWRVALD